MSRIPIIEIAPVGEVFNPTTEDRGSGIDVALANKEPILTAGQFELLEHPSVAPHTIDGEHQVYWLNRQSESRPASWNDQDLQLLSNDVEFLVALEQVLQAQRNTRQRHAWIYSYLGFIPKSEPIVQNGVAHIGLQSQQRLHFHITDELIPPSVDRWLEPENEQERSQIARFLNIGGESSISAWQSALGNFGQELSLHQAVNGAVRQRTAFGFESLAQAYPTIIALQNSLAESWYQHAQALTEMTPVEFAGYFFQAIQSAVPNFVIILPGEIDRQRLGVTNQLPVWVLPFSTVGAPEILVPGGAVLDRRAKPLGSATQDHRLNNPLDSQQISRLPIR